MPRPIWQGNISFGLINIPVALYSAENKKDVHFHLLDKKNKARIHYERINDKTGKEVDWNDVVKAYEFEKDNYVVVDQKELEQTAPKIFETVEIEDFIPNNAIEPIYFDKPYYLIPTKRGEKGFVLLRETLLESKKIGITKVVIKTRQYLAALIPYENILLLMGLRYQDEIRKLEEYNIPKGSFKTYHISEKEIEMAEKLIDSMSSKWNPKKYHNESKALISKLIERKIHKGKSFVDEKEEKAEKPETTGKVIDFMDLLKKSVQASTKHPAKRKTRSATIGNSKRRARKASRTHSSHSNGPSTKKHSRR